MSCSVITKIFKNKAALLSLLFILFSVAVFAQDAAPATDATGVEEVAKPVGKMVLYYVLLGLVGAMIINVIGKILKVTELTFELSGKKKAINWTLINAVLFLAFLIVGMYYAYWEFSYHGKMLLPESASEHGVRTDNLFDITLWITGFVFIVTHILLFGYAFKYRHQDTKTAYFYPHNNKVEIYWTVIPALVLTVLVVFGWRTWTDITSVGRQAKDPIQVELTAEQFRWTARYPGVDNMLAEKNFKLIGGTNELGVNLDDTRSKDDMIVREIVLPVNKPVKLIMGAKDVIHSAYMPHFRVQMNCVPGLPTYFYFTPTITTAQMREKLNDFKFDYILLCAKICGAAHYNMQMKVRIVSEPEYKAWLAEQKPFYTAEMKAEFDKFKANKAAKEVKKAAAEHEVAEVN